MGLLDDLAKALGGSKPIPVPKAAPVPKVSAPAAQAKAFVQQVVKPAAAPPPAPPVPVAAPPAPAPKPGFTPVTPTPGQKFAPTQPGQPVVPLDTPAPAPAAPPMSKPVPKPPAPSKLDIINSYKGVTSPTMSLADTAKDMGFTEPFNFTTEEIKALKAKFDAQLDPTALPKSADAAWQSYEPVAPPNRIERQLDWNNARFRKNFNVAGYHGTRMDDAGGTFNEFNLPDNEFGIHFGTMQAAHDIKRFPYPDVSGKAASVAAKYKAGAQIFPLRARIQNPLRMDDMGKWTLERMTTGLRDTNKFTNEEIDNAARLGLPGLRALLDSKGYDAIKYRNTVEHPGSISYMVWHREQLRVPWADFDPNKKQSANLMAGLAGAAAVPAIELAGGDRAEAGERDAGLQDFDTRAAVRDILRAAPETNDPKAFVHQVLSSPPDSGDAGTWTGDIVHVFEQGLSTVRANMAARQARGAPAAGSLQNPVGDSARASTGHLAEFMGLVGGATEMALSPAIGTVRHFARNVAGTKPEQTPAAPGQPLFGPVRLNTRNPSEVARASAARPFDKSGSPEEQLDRATNALTAPLPVVGVGNTRVLGNAFRTLATRPPVSPLREFTTNVADELHQIRQQGTADRAEITQFIKDMPAEQRTREVQETLYNFIERKDLSALPPEQQAVLNDPVQGPAVLGAANSFSWMRQELSNIYSRLRGLGFPEDQLVNPDYVHRRAVGHTPVVDPPLGSGAPENPIFGTQRTLPRTTTALQERKFVGGFDAEGERVVVSRDPDTGALSVHEPGARTAAPAAPHPTNPGEFLYNGRTYALGETSSLEIERATAAEPTPVRYHKNALANTADALARMRAVERHVDWLENLTQRPEWQVFATRSANQARRLGWEQSKVPQLRDRPGQQGWYLHPRLRAAFDDFYRPGLGESEALEAMRKVNQFATGTLFWNPVPHIENVLGHWVVGRGFDWIRPQGVRSMFVDGARAIRAVTTQNADYRRLLQAGSGMAFGGVMNADFYRNVARLAGMDIERNVARWDPIARMLGMGPSDLVRALYSGAARTLWWANDVLMMQRVLELERKGMPLAHAIREAEKHIPNYRIPTHVMGSREFSQILQEPAFTVFSRYHYGMFRSYANMLNDLARGSGREKLEAVGNMLALGLLTWVVYPLLDRAVRSTTGEIEGEKLRRGPSTIPHLAQEVFEGDESLWRIMGDAITLSLPVHMAGTLFGGGGRDPFTGQPVMQPGSSGPEQAAQLADYAAGQIVQPYQLLGRRPEEEGGRSAVRAASDQILGLKNTSPSALRGKQRAAKVQRRAAQKRRVHPGGPIERVLQQYGGAD